MISVILIWLYIMLTCYIIGFAAVKAMAGSADFKGGREISYLYAGIGAVTVYAQIFSIFWKVGLVANLVLLFVCILCLICFRKQYAKQLQTLRLTITPGRILPLAALFLLFAYGSSMGVIHYDTSLYHAQSIRWIEEYGIVPGLGNLHSRLAYNSASFCLSALYSMAFLGGQSFHCVAGLLAFWLSVSCLKVFSRQRLKKPQLSDLVRLLGIYYLLNIFDEMVSPASDYFMVLLTFFLVIRWLELSEEREESYLPYAMLCVLAVVIVSVKLSGALLLLFVWKPAWMLIRQRKGKDILKFIGIGAGAFLPFLIRNVILSGWLLYPFTFIDLFSFDFKIPRGMAEYDAREIKVYGRGFTDVTEYGRPFASWFPEYFAKLDGINKIFLILAVSGLLVWILLALWALIKKKKELKDPLFVAGILNCCFLFWLFSAPLIRYGCVFLWLAAVLPWGLLYLRISPQTDRFRLYFVMVCLLGAYKAGAFGRELLDTATARYLVFQKDYENYETISYELHGYTFYYPREGDRTGYEDFPSSPAKAEDIFRGNTIEEGFRDVLHSK